MSWIFAIIISGVIATGAVAVMLRNTCRTLTSAVIAEKKTIEGVLNQKREVLRELAGLALGFGTAEMLGEAREKLGKADEALKIEQGRVAVTSAERESADDRLRELEAMEKELESSGQIAAQELEMLRSQERSIAEKNAAVKAELDSALSQLDKLLAELDSSRDAVEKLNAAKTQMIEGQKKIETYTQEIANLNEHYMSLKKSYDALDIEYAQLYEKQNAMG